MGSWNKTCGLSNLHIHAGTPVYVFVLEEKRDDSNCYTTSLFRPLLLPFESEYNDYGGGENSKGAAFPLIIDALKKTLIEMPLGKNESHDIAVKREDFDEELFFESIHENRLFVHDYFRVNDIPVQITLFRKDIVDSILGSHVIEEYVGEDKGTTGWNNNYINIKYSDAIEHIPDMVNELSRIHKENKHFFLKSIMHHLKEKFIAAQYFSTSDYRYSDIVQVSDVIVEMLEKEQITDLIELMKISVMGKWIDYFMHHVRKTWIPGGHEGSQSASIVEQRLLCNTILAAIDKEEKKRE